MINVHSLGLLAAGRRSSPPPCLLPGGAGSHGGYSTEPLGRGLGPRRVSQGRVAVPVSSSL